MRIDTNGHVGIGTTAPGYKLDVVGEIRATTHLYSGTSTVGGNIYQNAVNGWMDGLILTRSGSQIASIGSIDGTSKLTFFTGSSTDTNTARMTITNTGNVGIGTTEPAFKLDVQGGADGFYSSFGNNQGKLAFASDATSNYIESADSGFTAVKNLYIGGYGLQKPALTQIDGTSIYLNGNVGIGTTAPAGLLAVGASSQFTVDSSGDITKLKNLTYSWPSSHTTDGFLKNNGSGTLSWTTIAGAGGVTGTGTDNYIPRWNGTTALENSIIYDTGTNVGIGTTSPGAKLTVQGTNSTASVGSELLTNTADRDFSGPGNWSGVGWSVGSGLLHMLQVPTPLYILSPPPLELLTRYQPQLIRPPREPSGLIASETD
jgi:hypothetical protein